MKIVIAFFSALLPLCLVPIALPMCLGEAPSADWSLLTGEPCEPPCWQGLTPGESTMEEVEEFLETSELVGRIIRRSGVGPGHSIYWESSVSPYRERPRSWDLSNWFYINSGPSISARVLKRMRILLDYDLSLEQLLERYGPPEKFDAGHAGIPERAFVAVGLFYPERGMMLILELPPNDVELRAETKVARVYYIEPTTLEDLPAALVGEHPEESLRDWQGYGPIER